MPKRPPCSRLEAGAFNTVHVFIKPGSKALYVRINCLDWLISYAADGHHFQGITRGAAVAPTAAVAEPYCVEWNFNSKLWNGDINVRSQAGLSAQSAPGALDREVWGKLDKMDLVVVVWSNATPANKLQKRTREY